MVGLTLKTKDYQFNKWWRLCHHAFLL